MENTRKYSMAQHGIPATGERLIGRSEQIQEIERRIIDSEYGPGNLALIGLPNIGKKSIIHHALSARREELFARENPVLVINVNLVSSYCTYYGDFFYQLFTSCQEELIARDLLTKPIERIARNLQEERQWGETSRSGIKNFFKAVHQQGIFTLFILENFDFIDELFRNDIGNFDSLRELATGPDYGVKLVALLQRTLKELGPHTQKIAISRFGSSFGAACFVGMFNDTEMQSYFERLASFGLTVTETVKAYIESCCGRHPYFLEMFGDKIDGLARSNPEAQSDIYEAGRSIESSLVEYIDDLLQQLRWRGLFNHLIQAVRDPNATERDEETKMLRNYGLIKPAPEPREPNTPTYVAFCTHLQNLLSTSELAPTTDEAILISWMTVRHKTENTLRNAADTILRSTYGNDWITVLEKKYPTFLNKDGRNLFQHCREKAATINYGTARPFKNLLGHTTMRELCNLILKEWTCFGTLFDEGKVEWEYRFRRICEVRNLDAHSHVEEIDPHELKKVEGFCHDILARLHFD